MPGSSKRCRIDRDHERILHFDKFVQCSEAALAVVAVVAAVAAGALATVAAGALATVAAVVHAAAISAFLVLVVA